MRRAEQGHHNHVAGRYLLRHEQEGSVTLPNRARFVAVITSRGHTRSMIKDGGVNAVVFIEFLQRLVAVAKRTIFLIVDRGPSHRAKKTAAFVVTLGGKSRLFFLLPYSPDRNPDEWVWKHLKAYTVGRMAATGKDDFPGKIRSALRQR